MCVCVCLCACDCAVHTNLLFYAHVCSLSYLQHYPPPTTAGLVLLYDWSPELWTLYAYFAADQTKPVIFNPLTEGKHAFFTDNDKLDLKRLKKQVWMLVCVCMCEYTSST
jgi:hypothetical protein